MTTERKRPLLTTRRALLAVVALALATAAGLALRPAAVQVEVAAVTSGPLRVVVEGTGRTRVRQRYVVSAPVAGHLERIALVAGDPVAEGTVVARISPVTPAPLDDRARAELRARLAAARAVETEAVAAVERARHAAELAGRERERVRALSRGGSVSERELQATEAAADERAHELEMATAAGRRARSEVEAARAVLAVRTGPGYGAVVVRSPAPGCVLRVLQESEGPLLAGTALLEVGDPRRLEVRVDLLTTDAVRVRPGDPVDVTHWGGAATLRGAVRSVEPSAFTKVSALGVEEQRVYVVVDPRGEGWAALGDGFSAEARITVSDRPEVRQLPAGALFRHRDGWAVFLIEEGRARLRPVRTGASGEDSVEIVEGVSPGARAVLHPSDRVSDGARVVPRR